MPSVNDFGQDIIRLYNVIKIRKSFDIKEIVPLLNMKNYNVRRYVLILVKLGIVEVIQKNNDIFYRLVKK